MDVVVAAERNHRDTLGRHNEIIATVRCLLARGYTDIEAMAHVAQAFSALEDLSTTWFLAALSVVERAKAPDPPRSPDSTPLVTPAPAPADPAHPAAAPAHLT
ncbi:hypothetical protein DMB66_41595 [Actinoplanes sp. ATCC 53533]|nr:hypothetical protein DMB66_41595 [Actinoplanes sp. ATCC 53533]